MELYGEERACVRVPTSLLLARSELRLLRVFADQLLERLRRAHLSLGAVHLLVNLRRRMVGENCLSCKSRNSPFSKNGKVGFLFVVELTFS